MVLRADWTYRLLDDAMKVYALLSWWDEQPEHLRRTVRSLKGFADVLVGVDGPYAIFPGAEAHSRSTQSWALSEAARTTGLTYRLVSQDSPWVSEVEKRASMFEHARLAGATPDDWFLIIDADMTVDKFTPGARELLAQSDRDVAEVRWHDIQIDGVKFTTHRFRSMFRALDGLTVERTHYFYVVPDGGTRRFLWLEPSGHPADIPVLDLTKHVTLHHFGSQRLPERRRRALEYYQRRDAVGLEAVGDWRETSAQ